MGQACVRAGGPRDVKQKGAPKSLDGGRTLSVPLEDAAAKALWFAASSSSSSGPLSQLQQQQVLRETLAGGSRRWRVASPSLVYCLINTKAARHAAIVFDCRAPQGAPSFHWGGPPGRGPLKLHYAVCPWRGEDDVNKALKDFNAEPPPTLLKQQQRPPVSRSAAANPAARSNGFVWPRMRLKTLKRLSSSFRNQQHPEQQQQEKQQKQQEQQQQQQQHGKGDAAEKQREAEDEQQAIEHAATGPGETPTTQAAAATAAAAASDSCAAVAASNSIRSPRSRSGSELLQEGLTESLTVVAIGDGDDDPLLLQFLRYLQQSNTQYTEAVVLAGGMKSLIPRYSLLFTDSDILLPGPTEIIAPNTRLVVVSLLPACEPPRAKRLQPETLRASGFTLIEVPFAAERKHFPYAEAASHLVEAHKQNLPVLVFDASGEVFAPGVAASFLVMSGFGVIKTLSHIKRKADFAKVRSCQLAVVWGVQADEAVCDFLAAASAQEGSESLKLLIRILDNVAKQPHVEKYRRLKLDNPRIKESISCHKPLLRVLRLSGFTGAPGASELVLPPDVPLRNVHACLAALQRQLEQQQQQQQQQEGHQEYHQEEQHHGQKQYQQQQQQQQVGIGPRKPRGHHAGSSLSSRSSSGNSSSITYM
ncbi:hypothetical protein Efla_003974 [Eimeria flavescens]